MQRAAAGMFYLKLKLGDDAWRLADDGGESFDERLGKANNRSQTPGVLESWEW